MDKELFEAACAVMRERLKSGAFTIAEGRLAKAIVNVTGKKWPECLGEPQEWELPKTYP